MYMYVYIDIYINIWVFSLLQVLNQYNTCIEALETLGT